MERLARPFGKSPSLCHQTMEVAAAPHCPVILFDGDCRLCNRTVRAVYALDKRRLFRFAALQSRAGQEVLAAALEGRDEAIQWGPARDSVVLVDGARIWIRSSAAIEIARRLGLPWSLAPLALIIPRSVRDIFYDWVARHRYLGFGRQARCSIMDQDYLARFLDEGEQPPRDQKIG
jgi:predicted DCC family thiol-disulfide oxidoreductase YuxK